MSDGTAFFLLSIVAGISGPLLGGLVGAALSRIALWKGAVVVAAGMLEQLAVGLFLALTGFGDSLAVDWLLFVVAGGLTAWVLGVGAGAAVVILVCGLLAFVLSGIAVVFGLPHLFGGFPVETPMQ